MEDRRVKNLRELEFRFLSFALTSRLSMFPQLEGLLTLDSMLNFLYFQLLFGRHKSAKGSAPVPQGQPSGWHRARASGRSHTSA